MLRLFSFLLIVLGAAALAYGGYQVMGTDSQPAASVEPPPGSVGFEIAETQSAPSKPVRSAPFTKPADGDMFEVAASTSDALSSLRTVPVAHETPKSAVFGQAFTVTLSLDATGDDTATDSLPGTGNIVEGEARVSQTVQALVSGESFEVEAITPATQRVSPLTENVWRWKVTPRAVGNQELMIEMFALLDDEALPLRAFRDTVQVEVSRIGQAVAIAKSISPITVVAGGIGSMLAGLFGFVGFFRRR